MKFGWNQIYAYVECPLNENNVDQGDSLDSDVVCLCVIWHGREKYLQNKATKYTMPIHGEFKGTTNVVKGPNIPSRYSTRTSGVDFICPKVIR